MTTQSRPIAMLCVLKYECPKEWATLATTAVANVRYCNECGKNVTLCFNESQLADLADQGECVAFVDARPKRYGRFRLGLPKSRGEALRSFTDEL